MNRFLAFVAGLSLVVALLFVGENLVSAQEIIGPDVCDQAPDSQVCQEAQVPNPEDPISGPGGVINTAANIIAMIGGIAAVIVIIISGIMFITAGGAPGGQRAGDSPGRAKKAQATLIGAVIGLIIIALSWSITRFIVDRVVQ